MAAPLPDFTDIALFPTFLTIPEQDPAAPPSVAALPPGKGPWYLMAQIKDNMTINKPTLVLTDRGANPFALVWEGLGRDDLDLKGLGFKKGCTAVIPYAWRTKPADEGKRGFVRVDKSDAQTVRAVPGALDRVLALGGKAKGPQCEMCGGAGQDGLKGCTGCERVGYCSKVSNVLFVRMDVRSRSRTGMSTKRVERRRTQGRLQDPKGSEWNLHINPTSL